MTPKLTRQQQNSCGTDGYGLKTNKKQENPSMLCLLMSIDENNTKKPPVLCIPV